MINFRYTCVTLNLRQIAWDWGKKEERWFQQGTGGRAVPEAFFPLTKLVILSHYSFHSWLQCWALLTSHKLSLICSWGNWGSEDGEVTTGAQRTAKCVFLSEACTSAAARRAQTTRLSQRKWRGVSSCRLLALPRTDPSKGQGGHRALEEIRCTTFSEQVYKEMVDYSEPSKSQWTCLWGWQCCHSLSLF